MLNSLRKFASTLAGKILGGLLLIGLAGFGISNVLTNIGSTTVANVGGQEISILDFQRAYQNQLNTVGQQQGQVPTAEQAMQMGIPTTVLMQLATEKTLNRMADSFNLGISDKRIAENLRKNPAFEGTLGNFDPQAFQLALQRNGYTESEFFQSQRLSAERQQLATALFAQLPAPKAIDNLVQRYSNDKRILDYILLDNTDLPPVPEPTEEDLSSYLSDHQTDFRTDETREVKVMVLTPDILAKGYDISDAEIRTAYENTKQNYVKVEKRSIQQVALPDDATVQQFKQGQQFGMGFQTLVEGAGLTTTDLGTLSKAQITDSNLADAAFGLDEGEFAIIPGAQGQRAIYVSSIEPGGQMSLEEAHDKVEQKLRDDRANSDYADVLDQIEGQRAGLVGLDEIADKFGLETTDVTIAENGAALTDIAGIDEADAGKIAAKVFSTEEDKLAPSVNLGADKTAWFDLENVTPARDETLDEVHDKVKQAVIDERQSAALAAKAATLVDAMQNGTSFEAVAKANSLEVKTSDPIPRAGDGGDIFTGQVAAAAFGGGEGYIGNAQDSAGDHVIFSVKKIVSSDEQLTDQQQAYINETYRNDLYSNFAAGLQADAGLKINQGLLVQAIGLNN